jgi:putative spermidine/putrescine transport system substrate-binding protein
VKLSKLTKSVTVAALAVALAVPTFSASAASKFSTAKSAAEVGGIKGLIKECKKEGALTTDATPRDWANYGGIYDIFEKKVGFAADIVNPNNGSQAEIDAANNLKGTKRSPDVFDISPVIAQKYLYTGHFAPYKVINWKQFPSFKDAKGRTTPNYTGVMSVGYDGDLGTIKKLDDLLDPKFKGVVALNGNPMITGAGMAGLNMVNVANGGKFGEVSKGVAWFKKLKDAGSFINVDPTPATIEAGQTRVVLDWSYNNKAVADKFKAVGKTWKIFIPSNAVVGSTYRTAISAWAPHPACARLWAEIALGIEGSNEWAKGGAIPTLWPYTVAQKKASAAAVTVIGKAALIPAAPTDAEGLAALEQLKTTWEAAVGAR